MNYKKLESENITINNKYDSLYRIVLTLSRKCNNCCTFCPQSNPEISPALKQGFMTTDVAEKILENLGGRFKGVFSLSGFGEPTLNPDFFTIVKMLKEAGRVDVISNGSDIEKLINCAADTIHISAYNEKDYESISKITDNRFSVLKKYDKENFNNRAGNVYGSVIKKHSGPCNILFMKLSIDYNGDIVKCCSDWVKEDILGNVFTNNIWDIWFNKTKADKLNMLNNRRDMIKICRCCDAAGDLYGNQYKDFWRQYYEKN